MGPDLGETSESDHGKKEFVEVSVSTTAGFYPDEGFDRVKADETVNRQLEKAAKKLNIRNTAGWVATVNGPTGKRALDPNSSYAENNLSGEIEIDWGPSEGGGGSAGSWANWVIV